MCSDEFGSLGHCMSHFSLLSLNSNVSKALPPLSPVQSDLKDRLISANAFFLFQREAKVISLGLSAHLKTHFHGPSRLFLSKVQEE